MFTAVLRNYKLAHPDDKCVVVSGYPEVFVNNPDVERFFPFAQGYLWQDYYGNPDWKVIATDPYLENEWIKNHDKHLIQVWSEMLGVPYVVKESQMWFSSAEVDEINSMVITDKPVMFVQSTGGSNPAARSWTRNAPQPELEEFLAKFTDHYRLHVAMPGTPVLQNVDQRVETFSRRQCLLLAYYCSSAVLIDSYGLHCRSGCPFPQKTYVFFPLTEMRHRVGYNKEGHEYILPRPEIQEMLKTHSDYYGTLLKFSLEDLGENCPVPPGIKWFDTEKIGV